MKILLIVGAILLFFGMVFGIVVGSKNNPGEELSEGGVKLVRWSIIVGFTLMLISGIIYLNK